MTPRTGPTPGEGPRESEVEIDVRQTAAEVIVMLRGELDLATVPRVERALRAVESKAPSSLVVDLSRLGFVDSSGVRLVLEASARAEAAGRRLAVVLGAGIARRTFDVLGLVSRFDVLREPERP